MVLQSESKSVLHYKGHLTFERIGILLNDLKKNKAAFHIHPVLYKKLLTLMIEVLENVLKYSDHFEDFATEQPEFLPEFELIREKHGFTLISRNPVLAVDSDIITERINKINASDEEELKKYYRETITNGMFTEKGGAGLGFIEMAKITAHPLAFEFQEVSEAYNLFKLKLYINHIDES